MRLLLTSFLMLFSSILTAPPNRMISIAIREGERDQTLLKAILEIETIDQNPLTVNWHELSHGCLQIRPILIVDVNRILALQGKTERFTIVDALDRDKSIRMFWIIQKHYNPTNDIYRGAVVWNGVSVYDKYYNKILAVL